MLHRFLQRFGLARNGLLEVVVGYLEIVFRCDGLGVADPGTHHVQRVVLGEFGLSGAPQVLPWFRPRF
jgi:hypothetical protein